MFATNEELTNYENRKLNEKYNGHNLFIKENDQIVFTFDQVPDNTYLTYLTNEYNDSALSSLRNFDEYFNTTRFISLTILLLIVFTFLKLYIYFL